MPRKPRKSRISSKQQQPLARRRCITCLWAWLIVGTWGHVMVMWHVTTRTPPPPLTSNSRERHWPSAGLMLGQRQRCWTNIKPALGELYSVWRTYTTPVCVCVVCVYWRLYKAGSMLADAGPTLIQRRVDSCYRQRCVSLCVQEGGGGYESGPAKSPGAKP